MVEQIEPPIVIIDEGGRDLMMASTLADAEGFLEPWSVRHGEFELFDSKGRLLLAELGPGGDRAATHISPTRQADPDRLRTTILDFLTRGHKDFLLIEDAEALPIEDLVRLLPEVR